MTGPTQHLEARIAALTGREHAVLTSRATAGLYLCFGLLARPRGKIVFPAILCPSPAFAALYAGFEPLFCDVSPATGNIDPNAFAAFVKQTPDVSAVVPTHLYGQPAEMERICEIAQRAGVAVIEDIAQALGASMPDGTPVGGSGTFAVLSFGHTKIVDAGYGGAIVTDDHELAERLRTAEAKLSEPTESRASLAAAYRNEYYRIQDAARTDPTADAAYLDFPERYRPLYLDRFDPGRAEDIAAALDRLDASVAARRRKASIYDDAVASAGLRPLGREAGAAPWRYGILLPAEEQLRITEGLRAEGFDASNWYPSIHRWFASGRTPDAPDMPAAGQHEKTILNLWLDDPTDESRVVSTAECLIQLVEQNKRHKVAL